MTTKKQILTDIGILGQQTDRIFLYPGLRTMRKAVLLEKLEIARLLLMEQGKFDIIVSNGEYTQHELFNIAVNGPSDAIEKKILSICHTIDALVESFWERPND